MRWALEMETPRSDQPKDSEPVLLVELLLMLVMQSS